MISSGDKNTNVFEIINSLEGVRYPTNHGISDEYFEHDEYIPCPRDERERCPLDIINADKECTHIDEVDVVATVKDLAQKVENDTDDDDDIDIGVISNDTIDDIVSSGLDDPETTE